MKRTIPMVLAGLLAGTVASAGEPWLEPGNLQARHDIQLLVDDGVIDIPLSQWPIATADLAQALAAAERKYGLSRESSGADDKAGDKAGDKAAWGFTLSSAQFAALTRLRVARAARKHGLFR